MKKIIKFLKNVFLAIVYPNRLLNLFKVRNLERNTDKILGNNNVVKIIALLVAIVIIVTTRYNPPTNPERHSRPVYSVPLTPVLNDNFTFTAPQMQSHIIVTLVGDRTAMDLLFLSGGTSSIRAYLDLDQLSLNSIHDHIPVRLEGIPYGFQGIASPGTFSGIQIFQKVEEEFLVNLNIRVRDVFDVMDQPGSRNRYKIELETEFVSIRGPQFLLNEILEVRAMFNAMHVNNEVGGPRTYQASIIAEDIAGNIIQGLEIYPEVVLINVEIYEDVKTLDIEVNQNLIAFPSTQYELISITTDIDELIVWGDIGNIADLIRLERINFNHLDESGQIVIMHQLPQDVYTEIDGRPSNTFEVVVTVDFVEIPPDDDENDDGHYSNQITFLINDMKTRKRNM